MVTRNQTAAIAQGPSLLAGRHKTSKNHTLLLRLRISNHLGYPDPRASGSQARATQNSLRLAISAAMSILSPQPTWMRTQRWPHVEMRTHEFIQLCSAFGKETEVLNLIKRVRLLGCDSPILASPWFNPARIQTLILMLHATFDTKTCKTRCLTTPSHTEKGLGSV